MLRMETNTDLRPPGPGSISDNDLEDLFNIDLSSSDFLRQLPASNIDALAEELEIYNGPSSSNMSKSAGGATSFGSGQNLSNYTFSSGLVKTTEDDASASYQFVDRKLASAADTSYPSMDMGLTTALTSNSDLLESPVNLATSSIEADSSSSYSKIDSLNSKPDFLYTPYSRPDLEATSSLNADLNIPYSSTHSGTTPSLNTQPSTSFSSVDTGPETPTDLYDNDPSLQDISYRNSYYPSTSDGPKNFAQHWAPHLAGVLDEDESVFSSSLEALNLLNPAGVSSLSSTSNNNKKEIFGTINSEISSVYQYKGKVIDNETVYLKRAHSMFDRSGIRVDNRLKEQIGVIKREHSPALAFLMDNNLASLEGKVHYNAECIFRIPLEITVSGDRSKKAEVLRHLQSQSIPFISHYNSPSPILIPENESPVPFDYDYDHVVSSRTFVTPAEMDNELDQMFKTLDEGDKMTEAESAPAVRTPLYPHQKQALNWMICKENNDLLPPFWEKRGNLYLNTLSKKRTPEKPKSIYGGILADDMGLGKTLEMISLILTNFVNGQPLAEPFPGYTRESFNKTSKSGPVRLKSEIDSSKGSPENGGPCSLTNSPPPPKLRLPSRVSPTSLSSVTNECQKFFDNFNKELEKSDNYLPSTSELTHSASFTSYSPSKGLKRSNCDDFDDDSFMSVFSPDKGKGIGKKSKHNNLRTDLTPDPRASAASDYIDLTEQGEDLKPMLMNGSSAFSAFNRFTSSTPYSEMLALHINRLRTSACNVIDVDALPDSGPYEDITPVGSPFPTEVKTTSPGVQEIDDEFSLYRMSNDSDTRPAAMEPDVFISSSSNKDALIHRDICGLVKSSSNQMFRGFQETIVISDSEEDDLSQPLNLSKDKLYKKKEMFHFTPYMGLPEPPEPVTWKKREVTSSTDPETGRTITNGPRGTLIICPLSVISNWVEQFDEHVDKSVRVNLHVYYGPKRTLDVAFLLEQDVVITTYATLSSDFKKGELSPLHQIEWLRIVLDEGHTIRNPAAQQTKAIFELQADRRWVLTGTPIQNSLKDLWSLINFLQVKPFTEKKTWNQIIASPLVKRERQAMKRVAHLVRNLAMRRTKHQQLNGKPLVSLPARHVYLETVTLNPEERRIYDAMQINGQDLIGSYYQKGTLLNNYGTVLTILLRLRQLCCHPQLVAIGALKKNPAAMFQDIIGGDQKQSQEHKKKLIHQLKTVIESGSDEECSICLESLKEPVITACAHFYCRVCIEAVIEKNEQGASCPMCRAPVEKKELYGVEDTVMEADIEQFHFNPDEWHSSSKVDALMKALNQLRQEDPTIKSVVVSQFTSLLSLLETPLKDQGFKFARLDGTMRANERAKAVHDFADMTPGGPTIFLLSLKAGGVGINLTAASRVFLLDPAWNPAAEDQCFDRCHRLGQTRDVVITKFVIEDSVEQRMLELQEKKKQLINGVLDKKLSADERRQKRIEEIRTLFNI